MAKALRSTVMIEENICPPVILKYHFSDYIDNYLDEADAGWLFYIMVS